MRQCPTCECFVPAAATRCPRCEAALEPIRKPIAGAEAPVLVAVGAGSEAFGPTVWGMPAAADAERPAPTSDDPHALGRYLGIPRRADRADHALDDEPARENPPIASTASATNRAPKTVGSDATLAAANNAAPEAAADPVAKLADAINANEASRAGLAASDANASIADELPFALPRDTFSALLGAPADADRPSAPSGRAAPPIPRLPVIPRRPAPPAAGNGATVRAVPPSAPVPAPDAPSAPDPEPNGLRIEPIAAAKPPRTKRFKARAPRATTRFRGHDPFARPSSTRERVLRRICVTLVVALLATVAVLRLPIGARPELGASAPAPAPVVSAPANGAAERADEALRIQALADVTAALDSANAVFRLWNSYLPATATVLHHAAPLFAFTTATTTSKRLGLLSLQRTPAAVVLAEYAGPGRCVFGRAEGGHTGSTVVTTSESDATRAPCRASAAPAHGWIPADPSD